MPNRRSFLQSLAACAGTLAAGLVSMRKADAKSADPQEKNSSVQDKAEGERDAGYSYRLPSFVPGSRLVFIGDSITDMKWGRNEKDRNHYLGHSYVYLIASRLGVDMPQANLEFFNRGHSGHRLKDLKARWQKDVIDMKPDLLSVLVGVNDRVVRNGKFDAARWEADYREVLTSSRAANKKLRIVLLDPFVVPSGRWSTKGEAWKVSRARIDQMRGVIAKLVKEFDAVHVPMQDVFDAASKAVSPEQWIWDGVHPLPQGHELIARRWLQEVSARWK